MNGGSRSISEEGEDDVMRVAVGNGEEEGDVKLNLFKTEAVKGQNLNTFYIYIQVFLSFLNHLNHLYRNHIRTHAVPLQLHR